METPSTNNDWTVHSLNIHGIFFQKLIASLIDKNRHADLVSTEYPVEFHDSYRTNRGQESRLDIRARLRSAINPNTIINLLIECKKANPEFVDWIFFPRTTESHFQNDISFLKSYFAEDESNNLYMKYDVVSRPFTNQGIETVDDARETRGTYTEIAKNKTKTSNASISEAAYQVVLATHAIADQDSRVYTSLAKSANMYLESIYLPVIVTTANLFLCDFDPLATAIETGEISLSKVNLKPVDRLFYEYPIPPHLQLKSDESILPIKHLSMHDRLVRRYILIINSKNFEETLTWLHNKAEYIVGG